MGRRGDCGAAFRVVLLILFLFVLSQAAWVAAAGDAFAQSAEEIARRNIAAFQSTFDPQKLKAAGLTQAQAEQMRKIYAFQISNDYTARRLLKTAEFTDLGREYYKMWFQEGDGLIRQVIGRAKGKMSGYSSEVLDLIEIIQNEASRTAMKAPMDFDVGIITRSKEEARKVLKMLGGPGGVEKFHKDFQRALEQAYLEVFESIGGTKGSINAARSFISATTGWHPEAYADVRVLKQGGVASKDLVQQTVDVSKYKVAEMRKHAEHGALTLDEAMEEAARGTAKDLDKVERVFNRIEKITGVKPKWSAEQAEMIAVLKKVEKMEMSAAAANAEIRRISGGRYDLFGACDNLMDQMESAWKLRPKKPQEMILNIFAEFLDDAEYDKSFKALLEGSADDFPAGAKKIIGEIEVAGKARMLSIRGGADFMQDFAKDFPAYKICSKPGDASVQDLIRYIESGSTGDDLALMFGKEQTERLRKIHELMKPEIKAKIQARYATNKFAIWELDQKGRILLGDPGIATLGIDAGVGLAMAFWQTSTIMGQNLSPDEESRQILNAWGTSLPVVGDIAQGIIEGIEAYYGDDKTKYFKAGAWLAIGAAGLVPGAQAPAMVIGLTLATYEVSSSAFDISKDKELLEAWLASGEFDKESGKLQKLYDSKGGSHELSFEGVLTEGGVPYKEVLTETTIRESVYLYTERNGLDQLEKLQSYIRALKVPYPNFPFKETLREPVRTAKPLFAAAIREGGAKEPFKTVEMLMFAKAKQIVDAEANRACQSIVAQVEAEYQARHFTGDAYRVYSELEALGKRLGLPLIENVNDIFKSFSTFVVEGVKTPWVRESLARRRVMLMEKYLNGYLEIEKSLKTIRGVFERAGIRPPGFNLSGFLEVDAPRVKDIEAAYLNRAIGESGKDVQAIHREISGDKAYVFNVNKPDPCDAELFKQLAGIKVRIVEAEDRRLLLEQWTGKKSAAEASRDASLRKAQEATKGMKTGSWVTIPSAVWDSLCENYEAAYAWGNVRWEGSQVYEDAIAGQKERIDRLTKEYADAREQGKEPMATCLAQATQGTIQVSNPSPAEGDTLSAKIVLTKGQIPQGAQWTWQTTGGLELGSAAGQQAGITARSSGTVTTTLVLGGKTLATFRTSVTVTPKDKKDGDKTDPGKTEPKWVPACTYKYSDWGDCVRATRKQTRTVTAKEPAGCLDRGKPELERGCTPPPTEEEKRHQYFNCLCRCSSGWAGHIGVWYDPEGKSVPECKSNGPCFGGAGAWGCTRRHFFIGPNDCAKGCWEGAFGKGGYDPAKADKMRKDENKKYKKPLKVTIKASKNPADFGDIVELTAETAEGSGGYGWAWGGCAQDAKNDRAKVLNSRDCKPCTASVTVTDMDGESASASLEVNCTALRVKLTKENPKENTIPIGGKATFLAEVFSGDKPASGSFSYIWERNPDALFGDPKNPAYETRGGSQSRNTATFKKTGTTPVWVSVFKEVDGRKMTVGESEQIPIQAVSPKLKLSVSKKEPLVGEKVVLTVHEEPAMSNDLIAFWWEIKGDAANAGPEPNIPNQRSYSFKPKNVKPVTITVHAKAKEDGSDLGQADAIVTAKGYTVTIGEPRYLGPKPKVWKCETQLGGACPGLVDVGDQHFAVHHDVFMKAAVSPALSSARYRWAIDPAGSCGMPGAGDEIKMNCSETGTYTVALKVANGDGDQVGEASRSVTISVSQKDLDGSKKAKEASDKLQKAKGLVAEGKLDEAIALANEAAGLDPKNTEAKSLAQKWGSEKQTVTQQIEKTKKLVAENRFEQAEKEFVPARNLHPKYPPVVETEKLLRTKKDEYKKNVTDKLAGAKGKARKGDYDGAIRDAEEAAKLDPANKEAAAMAQTLRKEKETIHQQIDKAKKLMDENRFADAQKELIVASNLNSYYPPVQAANNELGERWRKYNAEVQDKVYQVRSANEKKDFDKALAVAAAWRASTKLDPYAEKELKQQEDWAKQWKAQKDRQIGTLKEAGEKVKNYDYAGALKQYDEGFANGQNLYNGTEPEYKEAVELRSQAYTKNKRLQELIPWVRKAAEDKEYLTVDALNNTLKTADEAIALQPVNEQLKTWRAMIVARAEKTKADNERIAAGRKHLDAARSEENTYLSQVSYIQSKSGQWGENIELDMQSHIGKAIDNYRESLKYIPDANVEKKIKELEATLESRKKVLQNYRLSVALKNEADALSQQATKDPDIQSAAPKYDEAIEKYRKSLSLYRPFNAEMTERQVWNLEYGKHDRWVKKYWADGQALEKEAKYVAALAAYDKAIASFHPTVPQNDRMWIVVHAQDLRNRINGAKNWRADGEAKQNAGKIAEAIASYRQSLKLLPDPALEEHVRMLEGRQAETGQKKATADKLWQEGTTLFNQGRPSDALATFKSSLGYWSDATRTKYVADMEARRSKAVSLREQGAGLQGQKRIPEAIAKYKESLTYWPDPALTAHIAALEKSLTGTRPPSVVSGGVDGTWEVSFNNYHGKMELQRSAGGWTGRLWLDAHRQWEQLTNISHDTGTGRLEFTRPISGATQRYSGVLSGDRLEGTFTQQNSSGKYSWWAKRTAAGTVVTAGSGSTGSSPVTTSAYYHVDLTPYGGKKGTPHKVKNIEVDDGSWVRLKATHEKKLRLDIPLPEPVAASAVAVVSNLDNAHNVPDKMTTTVLIVHTTSGDRTFELKAGVHSSEWNRSETGGAAHAWPKETNIGGPRWMAVFSLPAGSVVTGLRFDHRDTEKKYYHGDAAPGFCLRGITLVRSGGVVPESTGVSTTPAHTAAGAAAINIVGRWKTETMEGGKVDDVSYTVFNRDGTYTMDVSPDTLAGTAVCTIRGSYTLSGQTLTLRPSGSQCKFKDGTTRSEPVDKYDTVSGRVSGNDRSFTYQPSGTGVSVRYTRQ